MAREIERRFLLKDPNWRPAGNPDRLIQGYFWPGETATGHIRIPLRPRERFAFVLKPRDAREFILPLPEADAQELLAACPHYLTDKWTIRLRRSAQKGDALTLKGPARDGIDRPEYEYPLPQREASRLLKLCADTHIIKDRYQVKHKGFVWDVDYYYGHLAKLNLATAEIELPSAKTKFNKPAWLGPEISFVKGMANAALARRLPLPRLPKVK